MPTIRELVQTKVCAHCGIEQGATRFRARRGTPENVCKSCRKFMGAAWKSRNPERLQAYSEQRNARRRESDRRAEHRADHALRRLSAWKRARAAARQSIRSGYRVADEFVAHAAGYISVHNGQCDICGDDVTQNAERMGALDHCHVTGALRGILCLPCNVALGYAKESEAILARAIEYLRHPPARRVRAKSA